MKTRSLLHRINRGLVLGCVLIVGLAGYLTVDAIQFNDEKAEIEQVIRDYAAAGETLLILPEKEQIPGQPASEDAINAKIAENQAVIDQYLHDYVVGQWSQSAYQSIREAQESCFRSNRDNASYVTDCANLVTEITGIKKVSPTLAVATANIKSTVKTIGNPGYILFCMVSQDDKPSLPEEHSGFDTETYTHSEEIFVNSIYLKKVDGNWKICTFSGYYNTGW